MGLSTVLKELIRRSFLFHKDLTGQGLDSADVFEAVICQCTEEDFTVTVDPVNGKDPATEALISPLKTQAEATAVGTFKTVPAAINALPNKLPHRVTVQIAAGDHTLTGDWLGDLERFSFLPTPGVGQGNFSTGGITYTSVGGNIRETGTSTLAVSSGAVRQLTLAADPGFAANAHRGKFLRVVSGTGAGQVRPIRDHTTTTFNIAGRFAPVLNATSVVEIIRPATRVRDDPNTSFGFGGLRGGFTHAAFFIFGPQHAVGIKEIELYSDEANSYLSFENLGITFEECRIAAPAINCFYSELFFSGVVFDARGISSGPALGGVVNTVASYGLQNDDRGAMFRDSTKSGLTLGTIRESPTGCGMSVQARGWVFDDLGGDGIHVSGPGNYVFFRPLGNAPVDADTGTVSGFCVQAINGGRVIISTTLKPTGGGQAEPLGVDGVATSYATISGSSGKAVIGGQNSTLAEDTHGI